MQLVTSCFIIINVMCSFWVGWLYNHSRYNICQSKVNPMHGKRRILANLCLCPYIFMPNTGREGWICRIVWLLIKKYFCARVWLGVFTLRKQNCQRNLSWRWYRRTIIKIDLAITVAFGKAFGRYLVIATKYQSRRYFKRSAFSGHNSGYSRSNLVNPWSFTIGCHRHNNAAHYKHRTNLVLPIRLAKLRTIEIYCTHILRIWNLTFMHQTIWWK